MRGSNVKSPISMFVMSVGLVAAVAVGTAGAARDAETKRRPVIVMMSEYPVVVVGRGFVGRARITLRVVTGSGAYAKALRATVAGTFRATFPDADAQCYPYTVTAVGRAGGRPVQTRRFNIPPPCGIDPQP